MFKSATLKLTGWYLLILMCISVLFSVIIYQVASSEISAQLDNLKQGILQADGIIVPQFNFRALRTSQTHEAEVNLFFGLFYTNIVILGLGGVISYLLARRTIEPIERAHIAQSRFTSDASHELRTPLATMKTELEVALRDPNLTEEEMRELLSSNLEEVDKLSQLSQTLLQLSRLDHSGITKERLTLNDLAHKVATRLDHTSERIEFTEPSKPLFAYAHPGSIEELLTILIDNALKYSPKNSLVRIKLSHHNKRARIEISNAGKGIDPKDLPHIFDRFYRADSSRTGGMKSGYGLGLSLAKKIVEIHYGDLSVTSAKDQTTTFAVSLPVFGATEVTAK